MDTDDLKARYVSYFIKHALSFFLWNEPKPGTRAMEPNMMGVIPKILQFAQMDHLDVEEEHSRSEKKSERSTSLSIYFFSLFSI